MQTKNNVLLEYGTGTWCPPCACAHTIIDDILADYPHTVILGYHGRQNDPWQTYSKGIISLIGINAFPSGTIGRRTGNACPMSNDKC